MCDAEAEMEKEILRLKDVSIAYDNEKRFAACDVSFDVHEGEYVCLIGSNGSGKSTLMKAIVGLVPLTKGSVSMNIAPEEYAYMAQTAMIDRQFPATVREVVLSGTQKRNFRLPFYTKEDKKIADDAMETFEITAMRDKRVGELSGGQLQRVLLARAFCRRPKFLILDEPCAGLDPEITEEFYKMLRQYNEKSRVTILMASHDMEQVETYASRVIIMNQTMEFDGSVTEWHNKYHVACGKEDYHHAVAD